MTERIALEKQQPKAEAQRMLEWKAQRVFSSTEDKKKTDAFDASIEQNYGHADHLYPVGHAKLGVGQGVGVVKFQQEIDEVAGLTAENRFWSAGSWQPHQSKAHCQHGDPAD